MAESLHEMAMRAVKAGASFGSSVNYLVRQLAHEDHEKAASELTAWAAANPVKTYRDDFFEKFPNAPRTENGNPRTCITNAYGSMPCPHDRRCAECWDAPLGTWGEKEKDDA